jgi:nucleoside-diphosphate-sugar epimerase
MLGNVMRHVIFGGNGFTGQHLADALRERGEHVIVCDLATSYNVKPYQIVDLRDPASLRLVKLKRDDIIYQLAARQYHSRPPLFRRRQFFSDVNVTGTENLLKEMERVGCDKLIYFSSDMVYGLPQALPVSVNHPCNPLGPYGESKLAAEQLCRRYRDRGCHVTIFRPRLIVGPGRLGILERLFRLIQRGWPVPLIGDGSNHYQMVSVFDCIAATVTAAQRGVPNRTYNLGSKQPPTARTLLQILIDTVGSGSRLISTPAPLVKTVLWGLDSFGLTLLYPEQFGIADIDYVLDTRKTEVELDWSPHHSDSDMVHSAFREYLREYPD